MDQDMDQEKPIMVTRSSMPPFEEYTEMIRPLWDSAFLTNMGVCHDELEAGLKEYLGTDNLVLFSNGHLALEMLIQAMHLTGEVITTPFTFASTTHAIVRNGLTPVFCDIKEDDYTIDADRIEDLITDKTSAILPVHVYGNFCDIEKIDEIAKKHGLKVIYDAAHAFGARYKGESAAAYGDAGIYSFHATKVFNTIEGGAAFFKDGALKDTLNCLKNFGIIDKEHVVSVGGNAKLNEFQAAFGICNLRHIDEEIEKRHKVYDRYIENLEGVKGIKLPYYPDEVKPNYAYFPVVFDGFYATRDEVSDHLAEHKIYARKYFYPIVTDFECYKGCFDDVDTPVARYIGDRVLTLPMYADLEMKDVDRICGLIREMAC